ncbi:MAG: hypothetical protein JWM39_457 [Parcubacteria group bacterium]|nr:hypothetical protein [Parcubacteria group bacterium]
MDSEEEKIVAPETEEAAEEGAEVVAPAEDAEEAAPAADNDEEVAA